MPPVPGRSPAPEDERRRRALSFGAVSEHYDRYRPGPSPAALDWLLPAGARAVVDVGAGTGHLTRLLTGRVREVTAVEPDRRMRAVLAERVPAATVLDGRGERLPVPDASQDAVLASSAWHWVDPERGVPEAARVLRGGGTLGLLWTSLDREAPGGADLWRMLRSGRRDPAPARAARRELWLPDGSAFGRPEGPHLVRFSRRFTREQLLGLAGTFSATIALAAPERRARLEQIRGGLFADPHLADPAGVVVGMVTHCWRARRGLEPRSRTPPPA